MNWKDEIVKLVYVKQALAEIDKSGMWPHHLPAVAATPSQIAMAEKCLGFKIDTEYADFLLNADGWDAFYQSVDLFGTKDFLESERCKAAKAVFDVLDEAAVSESGFRKDDLFPIAATSQDTDIFFMAKPSSVAPGSVVWFAGTLVERFPSFWEFFLAMVDYNRAEIDYFKNETQDRGHTLATPVNRDEFF